MNSQKGWKPQTADENTVYYNVYLTNRILLARHLWYMFALKRTLKLIVSTKGHTEGVRQGRFPNTTYPPGLKNRTVDSQRSTVAL